MSDLTFEKPGPGTWQLDEAHFSRPFSRWMQAVFPPAMQEGFGQSMAAYGALLDDPEIEPVNGFLYLSMRPVVGPAEASSPPPKLLFKLLAKVHPTMRRRLSRMAETFETKRWRDDLERWDSTWKPEHLEKNRSLQAVDPSALTDDELLDHVEDCRRALSDAIVRHHRMDLCALLPLGDFLAHVEDWTDRSAGELLGLFEGASPISAGATDELRRLASAIEDDGGARETLFSGESPGAIVDELRSRSDDVGTAMEDWLDVVGYRITSGYDVADFYALEKPSVLVSTLRAAVDGGVDEIDGEVDEIDGEVDETDGEIDDTGADAPRSAIEAVRSEVPPDHREQFDELYEEARLTYRIRDERSLHDLWTMGLMRRALLEAGRRLADRGALHEADHVVDLEPDELVAAFRDGGGPAAEAVAARAEHRRTHDNDDAPDTLGPPDPPSPPLEWLPEPAARGMRAIETMMGHLLESGEEDSDAGVVRGLSASTGSYEGPVRVVSGPDDFSKIQEGDVLVAETTSPAFNVVLPLLGAVVTDNGGALSHAAIVAREYGIPGVVGCNDATEHLQDGTRVVVDGEEGTVTVQP